MPRKAIPVKVKIIRGDKVAPGFTNYKLEVSKGKLRPKPLEIDKHFADLFLERMVKASPRARSLARKSSLAVSSEADAPSPKTLD